MQIEHRLPSAEEYLALRKAVGWKVPGIAQAEQALLNTVAGVVATDNGVALGLGRVVGDGAFYNFVVDLIVRPEEQGAGLGRRLLSALETLVADRSATGTLQLIAEDEVTPFYERCAYVRAGDNLLLKRVR